MVMAAPIGVPLTLIGGLIGFSIINKRPKNPLVSIGLLLSLVLITGFTEKYDKPNIRAVTTKVIIDASPETVWKHVIEFSHLDEPTPFIFNAGIAYLINAEIKGEGVGAIRYCNFSTGTFVEPITVWNKPWLLRFGADVLEQPAPMKELSFWDIDAPHLHDYFVSKKGQFKLTELPNRSTELEGTTWCYHNIKPEIYWKHWSEWIIHSIHKSVLNHIKVNSEKERTTS